MKNITKWFIIFLVFCSSFSEVNSQNQSVLLPIPGDKSTNPTNTCQLINFSNPTTPTINTLPSHSFVVNGNPGNPRSESDLYFASPSMDEYYLGQHPMYAQNVTYDENGEILFFIIDNNIYNRYGKSFENIASYIPSFLYDYNGASGFNRYLTAQATTTNKTMWMLSPEILVFPIPDKCFTYGLIYSLRNLLAGSDNAVKAYYRHLTILDDEQVEMSYPIELIDGLLSVAIGSTSSHCGARLHFSKAVSKERADGSRLLILNYWKSVFVLNIGSDGLISLINGFNISAKDSDWYPFANPEMEVVEVIDPATQLPTEYKLAVPICALLTDNGTHAHLMIYTINYDNLNMTSEFEVNLPKASNLPSGHLELIKGVEFSPDGSKVFVTYYGQDDIYYYDFDQHTLNGLNLFGADNYQFTSIERGTDGSLYFMANDQNGGRISRLNNPNNPHINNWQSIVFNTQIDELFYSYHYYDLPLTPNMHDYYTLDDKLHYKKLVFMDQIDGENYTDVFSKHWSACCYPYQPADWPATADFDQNCNPVWLWEPGDNPFGNTTSTVTIQGIVEIPAGKKVTIRNMVFEFKENAQLIVNRGGELLLDATSMTGQTPCGSVWKGIQVLGKLGDSQTSSEQGKITLINQSLIADAITGIEAGNSNKRNSGAIIHASNSQFRNCQTGIKMRPYHQTHSNGVLIPNQSYIRECMFVTTQDAPDEFVPESFIDISGIIRLRIEGNTFINERLNWSHADNNRGIGIRATDASVMVLPKCTTTAPLGCSGIPNSFEKLFTAIDLTTGLHAWPSATIVKNAIFTDNFRGVWANNPIGLQIASCDFSNNLRSVYLLNSRSSTVVNCSFNIPDRFTNGSRDVRTYGIYLDEGTGFQIEENEFIHNLENTHIGTYGIIVNNTGAVNNEIYKNYYPYSPLSHGIQAQYSNKGLDNNKDVGLMLFCNQFENPNMNIKVLGKSHLPPNTPNIGINPAQGIPNPDPLEPYPLPAGNSFSPAHAVYQPFSVDLDYSNFDADWLLYYHDVSPTLRLEPDRSSWVGRQDASQGSTPYCASKLDPQTSLVQKYSDLAVAETAWKASRLIRDIWVNGGLEDLGEVLETVTPWEAYHHYNELMSISPYVDVEALIAMIQNPSFTDLMVKLVCVANPHASRNDEVLQALVDRSPPMPNSYIEDILDESGAYSPLEQLNAQVAIDFHASRYIIEEIKRHYRLDTVNNWVNDSLTALLGRQGGLLDQYELAQHYLITGQLNDFQSTLENITTQFELTDQQLLDHTQFVISMQIALEILTDSIQPGDLDSSLIADLEALLDQDGSVKKAMALAILKWNNRNHHYSEPILDAPDYQPRKARSSTKPQESRSKLIVYPNPARDYFTLKYLSDRKQQNLKVVVVNNLGQALITWKPQPGETEILIDTGSLLPGAYTVLLYDGNTMLQSQKLIIIK
jgi:hypothetical protein